MKPLPSASLSTSGPTVSLQDLCGLLLGQPHPPWPSCHPQGQPLLTRQLFPVGHPPPTHILPICTGRAKSCEITQLPLNSWGPALGSQTSTHSLSASKHKPLSLKLPIACRLKHAGWTSLPKPHSLQVESFLAYSQLHPLLAPRSFSCVSLPHSLFPQSEPRVPPFSLPGPQMTPFPGSGTV